jgi:hypothetical protein
VSILWAIIVLPFEMFLVMIIAAAASNTNTNPFAGYTGPFISSEADGVETKPDSNHHEVTMRDSRLTD